MHNKHHTKETIEKIKIARARQIITEETKKKISRSLKGRIPWNKGGKMPISFREKLRVITKNNWQNFDIRKRRIEGIKKWNRTEEIKKKIGESNKKNWLNKTETEKNKFRQKARERQKRLWQNKEYRKLISNSHKGKVGYWRGKKRSEIAGENCHLWCGGKTSLAKKIRESIEYKNWRRKIFERDNFVCAMCGKRGKRMQVDHFPKSFAEIIREYKIETLEQALSCKVLWDVNNGRTLCLDCHKKTENYLKKLKNLQIKK